MTDILMPRLSDTMEEGVVASWSKKIGDAIKKGDVIGEIETDKTTMDLEAYDEGVLEEILVDEGGTVAIGEPIAVLGDGSGSSAKSGGGSGRSEDASSGEDAGSGEDVSSGDDGESDSEDTEDEAANDDASGETSGDDTSSGDAGRAAEARQETQDDDSGVRRSPLARRMAREHGIDLSQVEGTGPGGRIIRTDVERVVAEQKKGGSAPSETPAAQQTQAETGDADQDVKLTANQRITAERLAGNVGAPTFQETVSVRVDDLLAFRKTLNERLDDTKVSVNDLFVKACARALKDHPEINSSWGGDKIIRRGEINVGIAVALSGGLIVPVVKNADRKTLTEISGEARELAGRAKDGKLRPEEFKGGSFSISNLGMYGIDHFTALINPPEAAILAVGAAASVPYVHEGKLAERSTITMTMTVDHRVVNGAEAALFLSDLRAILEDPLRIVV
ncbi:dihydrolipoamide acetyltransferase family protein [Spelaeicoccus albus]|uniref:Dihydrolipoamide acetyltransferase component of pyruvate dehydrogenase complex n=1 Tax=Spelaeicoccus albus TaxID=1280376 RepID=A0A7Z0IIS6_9MICO|nr:dihydrolipoamide acetyltransferase family protein [Spelaeicoccus albus]NYI68677.1 pyruvate dehydrogenase E2 component (dihydrolipoamide acetyltransferase) [Spelaeicoccus albus]